MTARQIIRDAAQTSFQAEDVSLIGMLKAVRTVVPFIGRDIGRGLQATGVLDWSCERGADMGLAQAKKFVEAQGNNIREAIKRNKYIN